MSISRLLLIAAAAAGAAYYVKGKGGLAAVGNMPGMSRVRLALGGGLGGAVPASSPVAETMWTPSDPGATNASSPATGSPT